MTERAQTRQQTPSGSDASAGDGEATGSSASEASEASDGAAGGAPGVERRRNPRLRELVDEMLASVRVAARRDLWSEEERKQYEAELADIMRRVRFEAVWKAGPKDDQGDGAA